MLKCPILPFFSRSFSFVKLQVIAVDIENHICTERSDGLQLSREAKSKHKENIDD